MRLPLLPSLMVIAALASGQQAPPPYDAGAGYDGSSQDGAAPPDEPGRPVARVGVLSGEASVRRGDSGEWVAAALNAPLMAGDTISVSPGSAAELQMDNSSFARVAGDSELRISDFDPGHIQLQLAKGLVTYRVLRQTNDQAEISTPLAAVHPLGLASVRVEVAPDGSTRVTVRHGEADISTQRGSERVREGNMMLIKGSTDDPEFQLVYAPGRDQWDTWSDQRDAYLLRAQSPRYVSPDISGAEDLDAYGRWSYDPSYGNVWAPNVSPTWAPYRDGRWVWEDYYGWTWVDASPWGWAPFHYGSWYFRTGFGWCWFPGHRSEHYWYRPALVSFFGFGGGGVGVGFGFGNVGWIPLAPYERFHPWYGRGWGGGRNTFVNNINIVHNTNITNYYRNARFANGVTAVSGSDFQRGNFRNHFAPGDQQLRQASLVRGVVPMMPAGEHLRFSDRPAPSGPRADPGNQRFFGRMPVNGANSQRVPFAQQQATVRSAVEGRGMQVGGGAPAGGQRFGGPPAGGQRFGGGAPAAGQRFGGISPRPNSAPGWQRFGNPQTMPERQFASPAPGARQFAPQNGTRFDNGFRGQRTIDVAPPIVHQRQAPPSYSAPSYSAPSYNAPSYNRPSYNQPAYRAPSPNPAPAYRGGGGGGFGGPAYRSAPSAPNYRSAPAPSFRGGGGAPSRGSSGGDHGNPGGHGSRR